MLVWLVVVAIAEVVAVITVPRVALRLKRRSADCGRQQNEECPTDCSPAASQSGDLLAEPAGNCTQVGLRTRE